MFTNPDTQAAYEKLRRLQHKIDHQDGSPEALRRMAQRAGELRVFMAGQPLVVAPGTPSADDLTLY